MSIVRRALVHAVVLASAATLAHARGNLKELTVPLKFTPQEGVHESSADLPPTLLSQSVEIRVEDARKLDDPLLIGQGTGGDDKRFPIHADHDVAAFVQEVATSVAKEWALKPDRPAVRTLVLQLTRYNIDESNKALGSVYGAEVKFAYILKDNRG